MYEWPPVLIPIHKYSQFTKIFDSKTLKIGKFINIEGVI